MAYTIGKLAEKSGVGAETIRYYERMALLPLPDRSPSGYRQYGDDSVKRLKFIKEAQALGFTLQEIEELTNLTEDDTTDCHQINQVARDKIAEIDAKILHLQKMRSALAVLAERCPADEQPLSECHIIHHLYGEEA